MTIQIGANYFDDWTGDIPHRRKRVKTYARADRAEVGAQVLPKVGETFQIETTIFTASGSFTSSMTTLDALIGTDVTIVTAAVNFAVDYNTKFTVLDVTHRQEERAIRARGIRNGIVFDHSPAGVLRTVWTLVGAANS